MSLSSTPATSKQLMRNSSLWARHPRFATLTLFLGALLSAGADTITWTNTAGGNWGAAANWNPNQVPGASDTALITSSGNYTVTLDSDVTLTSLTLGGTIGTQTLGDPSYNLSLNGASVVGSNGVVSLGGGVLAGSGLLTVNGKLNWTGGRIGAGSTLALAANGVLVAAGNGNLDFSGVMTNAGTIRLTSGTFRCIALSSYGGGYGLLVNAPGGLLDFQADVLLDRYNDGTGVGAPALINQGTVRKSAGGGTSSINTPCYNSGTLDVQSGTVAVNGGGSGSGVFQAEAGATLAYVADYEVDGTMTGPGTNLLSGGVLALKGSIAGQFVWVSGRLGTDSSGTVAANGVLVAAGNGNLDFSGVMTNAGTIRLTSGTFRCIVLSSYGGGYGLLVNAPGGLLDFQADVTLDSYNDGNGVGSPTVINQGTVRKSGGSGTSMINPLCYNSGTLDVQTGLVSLHGGGNGSGVFRAEAGTTLDFSGDYRVDSALTGAGTNSISGGSFALNGSLNTSNAVLTGGVLGGTNGVIADVLTWTAGRIDAGSTLTVASNGVLVAAGNGNLDFSGVMTNAGTIRLTSGTFRCIVLSSYGGGYGLLINAPGGLVDFQADVSLDYYNDGTGAGVPALINQGTVRKSAGSGTSSINAPCYNSGTLDVQSGIVAVNGGGSGSGVFQAEAEATLAYPAAYEVDGQMTGPGTNLLNGGVLTLKGSIAGQFVWVSGRIGTDSSGAVATNGVLVAAGSSYMDFSGVMTNAGIIRLTSGTFRCIVLSSYGGGYGLLVNLPGGLIDFQADVPLDAYNDGTGVGTPTVVNQGTVRKSAGTGTSGVNPRFFNSGTLDAQSGTLSLNGTYDLTGGRLNFGLSSLLNFGQINLSGAASLTGTVSANLNNGYQPIGGNSFAVLTYGSQTGLFNNTNLPLAEAWSVTYGPTVFTLNVLNARPTLGSFTNQIVNELATLTLTNFATDADIPAQTLTFSFASAPNGMTITPQSTNAAVISWTPPQTSSPSTNTVSVVVTDNGSPGLSATNTFLVMVREVNVAPALPNIATQTVNELTLLLVTNTASEFNIHAATTGYGLLNPPPGMTISANGVIAWTPAQTNSPSTNFITTVVTNNDPFDLIKPVLTATNSFTVIVREINVAPTLSNIATQTVNELTLLLVTNTASELNIHAATTGYGLLNPPPGMTISANGVIAWTPAQTNSPSTNFITTVVTNNDPFDLIKPVLTATNTFTLIVREVNFAPTLPNITPKAVNALALLTVANTATETNIHATLSYTLVNPPSGASIDSGGIITWTPLRSQGPHTNTITTVVANTDAFDLVNPHLSATNSFTVIVYAPTLAPINDATVNVGQTVSFTAFATDNDSTRTLTFSVVGGPGSIGLSSGAFSWQPLAASAGTSNSVQIRVTDNSVPPLTDTKAFTVFVNALTPVELTPIAYTNGRFVMRVSGPLGPDYILQAASALDPNVAWANLQTNTPLSSPFSVTDTNAGAFTNRFYRVKLGP